MKYHLNLNDNFRILLSMSFNSQLNVPGANPNYAGSRASPNKGTNIINNDLIGGISRAGDPNMQA